MGVEGDNVLKGMCGTRTRGGGGGGGDGRYCDVIGDIFAGRYCIPVCGHGLCHINIGVSTVIASYNEATVLTTSGFPSRAAGVDNAGAVCSF